MKNWINKIPKEKLQRYIFLGALILVFAAFFISLALINNSDKPPVEDPTPPGNQDDDDDDDDDNDDIFKEMFQLPTSLTEYNIVRKFYEADDEEEDRLVSFHIFGSRYETSEGVSISAPNNIEFNVKACLSGVVKSVEETALRGFIVTIEHDDGLITEYSSLGSVVVEEGDQVKQGDLLGVSGESEYDNIANHVHLRVMKNKTKYDPEKLVGKTIADIK